MFRLVVQHFVFGAAGTAALLASYFFLLLPSPALDAENSFFQLIAQIAPGKKAVRGLQAGLLTFNFNPGGLMNQLHAGGGFVHFLPPLTRRANKLLGQIGLADSQLVHPLLQLFPFILRDHWRRETRRAVQAQWKAYQKFKFRLAKDF